MDSHVRLPPGHRINANTVQLPEPPSSTFAAFAEAGVENPGLPELRQAYVIARSVARALPLAHPGHRLVWVRADRSGSDVLPAHPDCFTIVGRHTQCGMVFDDPAIALRHLLVRSVTLPTGSQALRLLDLHTDTGFTGFILPDGSRQRSIFAEGPVAVVVGGYCLIALPSTSREDDLPEALPQPEVRPIEPFQRAQLAIVPQQGQAQNEHGLGPYRANARPNRLSRITLMPRLVMLGEALPPRLGRLAAGGKWAITLERQGRHATQAVSEEDLAAGVLIGRSEKCHSEALRRITEIGTSRVHVLIVREAGQVYAYDLASTQGTYVHGTRIRRTMLHDGGAMLTLGSTAQAARLFWRPVAP